MVADVAADVLALVKRRLVHVFLHSLISDVDLGAHEAGATDSLVGAVDDIGVGQVLGVDASAALDHRQLLSVEVLV